MRTIFCIFFAFCCIRSTAQVKPYFEELSVDNQLPENRVQYTLQDKLGYIWMGTQNGLARYDGYSTKIYYMPDEEGKPINYCSIKLLGIDSISLWAYVQYHGMYWYDRQLDVFKHIDYRAGACKTQAGDTLSQSSLYRYYQDKRDNINWFEAMDQKSRLFHFDECDKKTGHTTIFSAVSKGKNYLPAYSSASILRDANNNIWASTDSLLSLYNAATDSFTPYFVSPGKTLINDIYADSADKNTLWITTLTIVNNIAAYKGVLKFNTQTKAYKAFDHIDGDSTSLQGGCATIYTDLSGRLWFLQSNTRFSLYNYRRGNFTNYAIQVDSSFIFAGFAIAPNGDVVFGRKDYSVLYTYNAFTNTYTTNEAQDNQPGSLPFAWPSQLFFDKSGILWYASNFGGMYYLNPQKTFFNSTPTRTPVKNVNQTNAELGTLAGPSDDTSLYVKNYYGLYKWNGPSNTYYTIDLKNKLQATDVRFVRRAKNGLLYIVTNEGFFSKDNTTGEVKHWLPDPQALFNTYYNFINVLTEGNDGTMWVGTWGSGLYNFNPATGKFVHYPYIKNDGFSVPGNALDDDQVASLLLDEKGILWIGTDNGGVNSLDVKTGKFKSIHNRKEGFETVNSLCLDQNGTLWAGTYLSGLFAVNRETGAYKRYTEKDGLIFSDINSMATDTLNHLWITTNRGISVLDIKKRTFKNFTTANGLLDNKNDFIYRDTKARLVVFNKHSFFYFDPAKLRPDTTPPQVVLEAVSYHASAGAANSNDTTLFISTRDGVELEYNENSITLKFTALHFLNATLNTYQYKLDGYDKNWIAAGMQRTASYTKLPAGTYTFTVRAANADGVWNTAGASIIIRVYPPWWAAWWAYTLYALAFITALVTFIKYRGRKLVKQNLRLEKKVALRTQELHTSITELKATQNQLVQAEKMASLGELTAGIAHEIQNPLNFVNNFSELSAELLGEMNLELDKGDVEEAKAIAGDIKQNLEKITHHGKRADAIVKGMLQHSRKSTGQEELTDINALADEYLRLSYHGLRAKDKSFNAALHTQFDANIGQVNVVPQDIGRVLLNMYNNALYAVNSRKGEGYQPAVWVETKKAADKIVISIKDNGTGMPEKVKEKIFNPFFTTKPTGQGTGLGLSLSYDIIKAHGGNIVVETMEGEGTTFIITLPVK